jgi:hypothetical protein
MDCGTVHRKIDELREGDLSEVESAEIRKHISSCRECRNLLSEAEAFDKDLKKAFASIQPPSDFAARTARAAGDIEIEAVSVKPIVWVTVAAAACLVFAFGINILMPVGGARRESGEDVRSFSGMGKARSVGQAFSIGRDGRLSPYRGRTDVKVIWNISEGAPELIVDAFPGVE